MKFFALVIFLLPLAVAGQSKTDYEKAMATFQQFYNTGQGDSIHAMFGHRPEDSKRGKPLWTNEANQSLLQEYGILQSFRFIGIDETDPEKVIVFESIFSKAGTKTTSLTLYNDFKVGTFRFITSSDGINDLLRKTKNSR